MFESFQDPVEHADYPEDQGVAKDPITHANVSDGYIDTEIYPPDEQSYYAQGLDHAAHANKSEETIETLGARLETAVDEIMSEPLPKGAYSLETAERERPFTHYTEPGNIFQVLRFGLQSGNFKNRINTLRQSDKALDSLAPQMSGLRFENGGSYQGVDSISLGTYDDYTVRSRDLVFLVDPETKVFGLRPEERDSSTGYGHGIVANEIDGDFDIGNPTAYKDEVLAANIIPPSGIKAVVINERASIVRSLQKLTRNNAVSYSQTKLKNPEAAKEDLLANSRLIATLTGNPEAIAKVDALAGQVETMRTVDLTQTLNLLQSSLLQELVGQDVALSESTLREAIERKFGIIVIPTPK
jgi:hypothetical protein